MEVEVEMEGFAELSSLIQIYLGQFTAACERGFRAANSNGRSYFCARQLPERDEW